jgi:hypothetical protein
MTDDDMIIEMGTNGFGFPEPRPRRSRGFDDFLWADARVTE